MRHRTVEIEDIMVLDWFYKQVMAASTLGDIPYSFGFREHDPASSYHNGEDA